MASKLRFFLRQNDKMGAFRIRMTTITCYTSLPTPIGELFIEGNDKAVTRIWFEGEDITPQGRKHTNSVLADARRQLKEYFEGKRADFDLPLEAQGTDFQKAVWKAMSRIRYGQTSTYGQLAKAVHRPVTAARGVGQACGHNPLPVVVPCHRVLGKNGELTGYGGKVWRKEWLLAHEQTHHPAD